MVRIPGWLAFLLFVPLQVWLFFKLKDAWGLGLAVLTFLVLGFLATRAARAPWLMATFFPGWAERRERRRHVYQGVLFLLAAVTFLLPWGPQPWLAGAAAVSLVKASVR